METRYSAAPRIFSGARKGFTLVELITVITIIAILTSLLVTAVLGIQKKAKVAKSEALFGKLINSLTLYRKDNGAYPDLGGSLAGGDVTYDLGDGEQWKRFAETMALSQPDGAALEMGTDTGSLKQTNPKLKRYFDLQLSELESVEGGLRLVDAFGNPRIYVVVDADLDGRISRESLPDNEKRDLRQRIVVYTTDEGKNGFPELHSWDSF